MAKNVVVVGAQWGDEGKGKIVDWLTSKVDGVVRFNGGNNAGHTIVVNGNKPVLRLIPAGVMHPTLQCYLGNGVGFSPCKKKIGTTGRGIGPAYEDKVARRTVRVADLYNVPFFEERVRTALEYHNFELTHFLHAEALDPQKVIDEVLGFADRLKPRVMDVSHTLNKLMAEGKQFLFEGAQGSMLDIDHGTYPYVTSSNPTAANAATGSGVGPLCINHVVGVVKAYTTRVGEGPFVCELFDADGNALRERGHEYGTVTGRPRRCGWLDAFMLKYSARVNSLDCLAVTRLDILDEMPVIKMCVGYKYNGEEIKQIPASLKVLAQVEPVYEEFEGWMTDISGVRKYEDLPENCKKYLKRMSEVAGVEVGIVSVGPDREQTMILKELF